MIIHYIQHNFADWSRQTAHMSNLEVGIFTKLRSMYFTNATKANGKIDANDFEGLCYRLSCKTEEEINAIKLLLKDQFKKIGNFYVNDEWDQQILAILGNHKRLPWNEWKVTRQRIFERDGFTCTYCGSTATNLECDHIQPISRGGSNDDYNLTTACTSCNRKKHNKLLGEWS